MAVAADELSGNSQPVVDAPNLFQSQHGRLSQLLDVERGNVARQLHDSVRDVAMDFSQRRISRFAQGAVNVVTDGTIE